MHKSSFNLNPSQSILSLSVVPPPTIVCCNTGPRAMALLGTWHS
jgi:hypothetical protein